MNRKQQILIACMALLGMLLCSCGNRPVELQNPTTGLTEVVYLAENDAMSEADATAIKEILSAFESSLAAQDATDLMPYMDETFTATKENLTNFFKGLAQNNSMVYNQYDQYYVRGLEAGTIPILVKKSPQEENAIQMIPASSELYVALYASEADAPVSTMLSLMCAKKGGKWRVAWIDISDYLYHGEDANALYARAKEAYDAGKVLPAFLLAQMTANLATPGNVLRYPDSDAVQEFVYRVMSEGLEDYPLPMELPVKGVSLRSVATSKTEHGVVPMFFYTTETPLSDGKALRSEAEAVSRAIGEIFPGTTQEFSVAEFRMTNQDPETEENFDYETIIIKQN